MHVFDVLYLLQLIATAVLMIAIGVYIGLYRPIPGALSGAVAVALVFAATVTKALEITSLDYDNKVLWYTLTGALAPLSITAVQLFFLDYLAPGRWLTRRNVILFYLIPVLISAFIATNDIHYQFWSTFTIFGFLRGARTDLAWAALSYFAIPYLITTVVLVRLFVRTPAYRWSLALIFFALVLPVATDTALNLNLLPRWGYDPTNLVLFLVAAILFISMWQLGLFQHVPASRDLVVDRMSEGMLLLGPSQQILDWNPAARTMLRLTRGDRDAVTALGAYPEMIELIMGDTPSPIEFAAGEGAEARVLEARLSPCVTKAGLMIGRLILLSDITARKHAEEELLVRQRGQATLEEQARLARELHDSLGQVLTFIVLQAENIQRLVTRGEQAESVAAAQRLEQEARHALVDVREYIIGAKATKTTEGGFLPGLRRYVEWFQQNCGICVDLVGADRFPTGAFQPVDEPQVLRIVQEALTNVRKHSGADRALVRLSIRNTSAVIIVEDHGKGFERAVIEGDEGRNYGVHAMRDRAEALHGGCQILSEPGKGTRVVVEIPLAAPRTTPDAKRIDG